jgi:hypothetical protein
MKSYMNWELREKKREWEKNYMRNTINQVRIRGERHQTISRAFIFDLWCDTFWIAKWMVSLFISDASVMAFKRWRTDNSENDEMRHFMVGLRETRERFFFCWSLSHSLLLSIFHQFRYISALNIIFIYIIWKFFSWFIISWKYFNT